jgi:hypothetical protein
MDSSTIQDAAQATWDMLPLPAGTYRYVFARKGSSVRGTWVPNLTALARIIKSHPDWNLYIQLNPARSRNKLRPSASDVSHIQAVLVDIDPVDRDAEPFHAVAEIMRWSLRLGIGPECCAVIDSGRGTQLWFLLEPMAPTPENAGRVRAVVKMLAESFGVFGGCRIDTSCSDLARLARLPGSINQKTGHMAQILVPATPMPGTWLEQVEPLMPPALPESRDLGGETVVSVLAHISDTAADFLQHGKMEPGRHATCFHTMKSLFEAGVRREGALSLCLLGASRSSPALDACDVTRIHNQVYGGS